MLAGLFANEVHRVLVRYNMLDDCMAALTTERVLGKTRLAYAYIKHRARQQLPDDYPQLAHIRNLALRLAPTPENIPGYIESLCECAAKSPRLVFCEIQPRDLIQTSSEFNKSLRYAAEDIGRIEIINAWQVLISLDDVAESILGECLLLAVQQRSLDLIQCLLQKNGAHICRGQALRHAAHIGQKDLIKLIFTRNMEQNPWRVGKHGKEDEASLIEALGSHSPEIHDFMLALYLEHGIVFEWRRMVKGKFERCLIYGWTDLGQRFWRAAYEADFMEIEDMKTKAMQLGNVEFLMYLKHMHDESAVKHREGMDTNDLRMVAKFGYVGLLKFMLKAGSGRVTSDILCAAIQHGHVEIVQTLLDHAAHLADYNAIVAAARYRRLGIARMLLERGADPSRKDPTDADDPIRPGFWTFVVGMLPICSAVLNEDICMFELLRSHGARLPSPYFLERCKEEAKIVGGMSMLALLEPVNTTNH